MEKDEKVIAFVLPSSRISGEHGVNQIRYLGLFLDFTTCGHMLGFVKDENSHNRDHFFQVSQPAHSAFLGLFPSLLNAYCIRAIHANIPTCRRQKTTKSDDNICILTSCVP
nr:hypothetical transcript [Hymenolepis microstoma]